MDRLKRLILFVGLILLAFYIVGFAFPNEPDGFRNLKWGDAPTEGMIQINEWILDDVLPQHLMNMIFIQVTNAQKLYYIENDSLSIGSAKLDIIYYNYNIYSNELYRVSGIFTGETNYNILKIVFEDRYGKPTDLSTAGMDGYLLEWKGDKAEVQLYYNTQNNNKNMGWFAIESMQITLEKPLNNLHEEIEKAKDDF